MTRALLCLSMALSMSCSGKSDDSAHTDGTGEAADGADGAADGADGTADGADGAADGSDGTATGLDCDESA
jgi:hypothetical protein